MHLVLELWRRLLHFVHRRQFERELDEEMRFHVEMRERDQRERGLSAEDAARSARRQFGNSGLLLEDAREAWLGRWVEDPLRDLRIGARMLRRNPGFTAVAILTLALGLGANLAIFTVLYNVVLRPLPYRESGRLMHVFLLFDDTRRGTIEMFWSYPKFQELRRLTRSFQFLAALGAREFMLGGIEQPQRVMGEYVSASYFPALGIEATRGRVFSPEEDSQPGAGPVVIIADGLWRRVFGGDPRVIGRTLRVNATPFTIVGVAPPGFRGESGRAELWVPMAMAATLINPSMLTGRAAHWHVALGRVNPGVSPQQAAEDVRAAVAQMERANSSSRPQWGMTNWRGAAEPLKDAKIEPALARSLLLLQVATVLVLLIACLNLANLLLGRAIARSREVAVRMALGAGRAALVRQFLGESLLIALAGCSAGLVLAWAGLRQLGHILPAIPAMYRRALDPDALRIEAPVAVFGVLLALATALIFGGLPAWQASRPDLNDALKSGGAGSGPRQFRLRAALAAGQTALALILLIAAGLMLRSFGALLATRIGAETRHIVTLRVILPGRRPAVQSNAFYRELRDSVALLPGVERAVLADTLPVFGHSTVTTLDLVGRQGLFYAGTHTVSPDYFSLFRIPLLKGRTFDDRDREDAPRVVLINQEAARRFYPGEDPLGKGMACPAQTDRHAEIVGVVGDVRYEGPEKPPMPEVYMPEVQVGPGSLLAVRTAGDPAALVAAIRDQVKSMERDAAVHGVMTMEQAVASATSRTRFSAVLLAVFSGVALALAAVGVYGVFAYAVTARSRELGIRIAIGARGVDIQRLIFRDVLVMIATGIAVGIPVALAACRALGSMLYQVKPGDPATYAAVTAVLAGAALLAAWVPVRRAANADPLTVLRAE